MPRLPFDDALEAARTVLLAGAGGGFDVFGALPLHVHIGGRSRIDARPQRDLPV